MEIKDSSVPIIIDDDPVSPRGDGIILREKSLQLPAATSTSAQKSFEKCPEMESKIVELQKKVESLEAEKRSLLGLMSEDKAAGVSVGTETELENKDQPIRHPPPPASIMSLSTGSDESAVEDEKFVKIKPCEIESSSSKASSQSGKENLELEEQISHLNEQIEFLKQDLKTKDEECKAIKLQLESTLLERDVESHSISNFTVETKLMKEKLIAKDQELEEFGLVLEDLLDQIKPFISLNADDDGSTIEGKLNLMKEIPSALKSLSLELQEKQHNYQEVSSDLKELQDQQSEIIGGYQLITENYEKLQSEFEDYKQKSPSDNFEEENKQLNEELERFREELLSKDEDLMEIQTKCEELMQNLELKNQELKKLQELKSLNKDLKMVDQSVETDPQPLLTGATEDAGAIVILENIPNVSTASSSSSQELHSERPDLIKIKKLKEQCLNKLRLANNEHQKLESSLRNEIIDLQTQLSLLENEMTEKTKAMNELLLSVQEYEISINKKTSEINDTIEVKNQEINNLMDTYNSYYESTEQHVADLRKTIEEKNTEITSLQHQLKNYTVEVKCLSEELKSASASLQEEIRNRTTQQKYIKDINADINRLQHTEASLRTELQSTMHAHALEIARLSENCADSNTLKKTIDSLNSELSSLKVEHLRVQQLLETQYTKLLEDSKRKAKEEYDSKLKEEEVLRETEVILLQQKILNGEDELKKALTKVRKDEEVILKLKAETEKLLMEIARVQVEKESLQVESHLLKDEIRRKDELTTKLETELKSFKHEVEMLQDAIKNAESRITVAEARVCSHTSTNSVEEESPTSSTDSHSKDSDTATPQLQERINILNELMISKERKIDLLQSKISEIETSEIKAFEESFMLKGWVRQLELDNLKYQEDLANANSSDTGENPKIKTLQDEIVRLIYALDERDKRCVQLTLEITRLLEERDTLQLKLSNVLKHNVELMNERNRDDGLSQEVPSYDREDVKLKLAQLEDTNFRMDIDLKRERQARKLVQEQLLFSQTSRVYRERREWNTSASASRIGGGEKRQKLNASTASSPSESGHVSPTVAVGTTQLEGAGNDGIINS